MTPYEEVLYKKIHENVNSVSAFLVNIPQVYHKESDMLFKRDVLVVNMEDGIINSVYAEKNYYHNRTSYMYAHTEVTFAVHISKVLFGLFKLGIIEFDCIESFDTVEEAMFKATRLRMTLRSYQEVKASFHNEYYN